jgi:hypothetical protein
VIDFFKCLFDMGESTEQKYKRIIGLCISVGAIMGGIIGHIIRFS